MTSLGGGPIGILDTDIISLQNTTDGQNYHTTWADFRKNIEEISADYSFLIQRGGLLYYLPVVSLGDTRYSFGEFDFILVQRDDTVYHAEWKPIPDLRYFTLECYDWLDIPQKPEEGGHLFSMTCSKTHLLDFALTIGVVDGLEAFITTPSGQVVILNSVSVTSKTAFEYDEPGIYKIYARFKGTVGWSNSVGLKGVDWGSLEDLLWHFPNMVSENPFGSGLFTRCPNFIELPSYTKFGTLVRTFENCTLFNGEFDIVGTMDTIVENIDAGYKDADKWAFQPFAFSGWNNADKPLPDIRAQTSRFTGFGNLFYGATKFNQPLDDQTVDFSAVEDFSYGFFYAAGFNQSVTGFHMDSATNCMRMFQGAIKFNQDVGAWNMSNCHNLVAMFTNCFEFNNGGSDEIRYWDTANVTNAGEMFMNAAVFNQSLSNWDTSKMTTTNSSMIFMFANAVEFQQDLSMWCVEDLPTKPREFDFGSKQTPELNPQWGEPCP